MSMTGNDPDILTLEQAADYLQVSRTKLYQMCRAGTVPAAKIGNSWRFHREALAAFIISGGEPRPVKVAGVRDKQDECSRVDDLNEETISDFQRQSIINSLQDGNSIVQAALKVSVSPRTLTQLCAIDDELSAAVSDAKSNTANE